MYVKDYIKIICVRLYTVYHIHKWEENQWEDIKHVVKKTAKEAAVTKKKRQKRPLKTHQIKFKEVYNEMSG